MSAYSEVFRHAAHDVATGEWTEAEALADLAITFGRPVDDAEMCRWRRELAEARKDAEWEQMRTAAEWVEASIG